MRILANRTAGLAWIAALLSCGSQQPSAGPLSHTDRADAAPAAPAPAPPYPAACIPGSCSEDQYCNDQTRRCESRGLPLCAAAYCTRSDQCGTPDDRCLVLPSGEQRCGRACVKPEDCPEGFACEEAATIDGRLMQCTPEAGVCDSLMQPCASDADCREPFDHCVTDESGSYCSLRCSDAGDCPAPLHTCAPGRDGLLACQWKVDVSRDACPRAANDRGIGTPCVDDAACLPLGLACHPLPGSDRSLCTTTCTADVDCGPGAACLEDEPPAATARCVPLGCSCHLDTVYSRALKETMAQVEREPCFLGHQFGDLNAVYTDKIANDPARLGVANRLYYAPLSIPYFRRRLASEVKSIAAGSARPLTDLITVASRLDDSPASLPQRQTDLERAMAGSSATQRFSAAVRLFLDLPDDSSREKADREITASAAVLPEPVQAIAADLLSALYDARTLRDEAIAYVKQDPALEARFYERLAAMFLKTRRAAEPSEKIDLDNPLDRAFLLRHFDLRKMAQAALLLTARVEAGKIRSLKTDEPFRFTYKTPSGWIDIAGGGDDQHDPPEQGDENPPYLLCLDLGGDDTYRVPLAATSSPGNPVSLAIDLEGDDTYTYVQHPLPADAAFARLPSDVDGRFATFSESASERPRQGAGILGVGIMFDYGRGADRYQSLRFSQGFGMLGVGALHDDGGDDVYQLEAAGEGSGFFGIGVLHDAAGSDRYRAYTIAQGAALVKGVGVLVDTSGGDDYWVQPGAAYIEKAMRLDDHDYMYVLPPALGAALGRRGDYPLDGVKNFVHLSGGFGALFDLAGDDSYQCGAWCLGTGYWFGVGFFYDEGGNDSYGGRIYVGGSGAHFGLGLFYDGAGNDDYLLDSHPMGLSLGYGHDFSLGWHEDGGGNDVYRSGYTSFGVGNTTSTGFFWNIGGADSYTSLEDVWRPVADVAGGQGYGLGKTPPEYHDPSHKRYPLRSNGIFIDLGGVDTYVREAYYQPEPVKNDAVWMHPDIGGDYDADLSAGVVYDMPQVFGIGLDRDQP